jgi:hypothetical protein
MSAHGSRERERPDPDVRLAAGLTDQGRIRILRDLPRTAEAIQRTKPPDWLRREEDVRRLLEDDPALGRWAALAERLG